MKGSRFKTRPGGHPDLEIQPSSEAAPSIMAQSWPWGRQVTVNKNSEPQTLEALQNTFILIYRCAIYPCYVYILFTWKSKCSRGCCFYNIIFFDVFLLFSNSEIIAFNSENENMFINHNRFLEHVKTRIRT